MANLVSELVAVCVRRQVFEGRWASLSGLAEDVRKACGGCALLASRNGKDVCSLGYGVRVCWHGSGNMEEGEGLLCNGCLLSLVGRASA